MMGIRGRWNKQADEFNQWPELDLEEIEALADKEIDQLRAHIERLQEAFTFTLDTLDDIVVRGKVFDSYSSWKARAIIDESPQQSTAAIRREVIEECALICDRQGEEWDSDLVVTEKNYAAHCARLIRASLPIDKEPTDG